MPKHAIKQSQIKGMGKKVKSDSAHTIHFECEATIDDQTYDALIKINKEAGIDGEEHSMMEAAAGEVTRFFTGSRFSGRHNLVVDEAGKHIIGVAPHDFSNQIRQEIAQGTTVLAIRELQQPKGAQILTPANWKTPVAESNLREGYAFLDEQPQNTFDTLIALRKKGQIDIDMDSLASILTAAYVMEEDDLHKGNIGYFVTKTDNGKPTVHFFKIDHDLMFADSIMSRRHQRALATWDYTDKAFRLTADDIKNFPDIHAQGFHYWPTQKRTFVKGDKAYTNAKERQEFAALKDDPDFKVAKIKYLLKFTLLPREYIDQILLYHMDPVTDADNFTLIQTALNERLSELRRVFFTSEEFQTLHSTEQGRQQLAKAFEDTKTELWNAYCELYPENKTDLHIKAEMVSALTYQWGIIENAENLSAIEQHVLLGDYDFQTQYSDEDLLKGLAKASQQFEHHMRNLKEQVDAFRFANIMFDMQQKLSPTTSIPHELEQSLQKAKHCIIGQYLQPNEITTFMQFKAQVELIRRAGLPLKQQKAATVQLLKAATKFTDPEELNKLAQALDRHHLDPQLKFIRQLRSELWIIRLLRKAYGYSSTASEILDIVRQRRQEQGIENATVARAKYLSDDIKKSLLSIKFFGLFSLGGHEEKPSPEPERPDSDNTPKY